MICILSAKARVITEQLKKEKSILFCITNEWGALSGIYVELKQT